MRAGAAAALAAGLLALAAPAVAMASGPPLIGALWSSQVLSGSARLSAEIDPNGLPSHYRFEYIKQSAYEANIAAAKEPFTGALKAPPVADANLAVGGPPAVSQLLFGLSPDTAYRYRALAANSAGPAAPSVVDSFATQSLGGGALLPNSRGWEMVSPVQKNGGRVDPPGAIAGGGVLQAAANGQSVTYGSSASFAGGSGAPPASQYIATRGGGGWSTQNITAPLFSGSYDTSDQGVPYQLFSADLARALLLNGSHCRGGGSGCAVANPPLAGTDAPVGYQDYYLRENATGSFAALLGAADITGLALDPAHFDLRFSGASPDLRHMVLSSCAALTSDASEFPLGEGCDPTKPNLYEWSAGEGLSLVNAPPAEPGAELAAQSGAVSEDGSRVYWTDTAGNLYLREGAQTKLVAAGATFQTASADGSKALYTKADEHLYRYDASSQISTDLTPSGGVVGVLGASADGSRVYYQDAGGLRLWHSDTTTTVAPGAAASDEGDYPPTTGTARVSADGAQLLFVSKASLSGFDNTDLNTEEADSEVYLYDAGAAEPLICVSCNPTNERPIGPSTIPGAIANGTAEASTDSYKPRVLATDGRRVFFDSRDALSPADTNTDHTSGEGIADVYQWEAQGEGSCARAGGCIALISGGRNAGGASFVDASADGSDAFFLSDASLVKADPGAIDLYDARIGGGFEEPSPPIPCEGDACQFLPPEPIDPTLTTLLAGPGNPALRYLKRCTMGLVKRHGKCVVSGHKKHQGHKPRRGSGR